MAAQGEHLFRDHDLNERAFEKLTGCKASVFGQTDAKALMASPTRVWPDLLGLDVCSYQAAARLAIKPVLGARQLGFSEK